MKISFGAMIAAASLTLAASALPSNASAALTFTTQTAGDTTGAGPFTLTAGGPGAGYSVLRFINNEAITFGELTELSLDFEMVSGVIGSGSPRLAVVLANDDQFLIHLGNPFSGGLGLHNTGNLIGNMDAGRYELNLGSGAHYTDYAAALSAYGSSSIKRFSVIADDSGAGFQEIKIGADGLSASGAVPEPATWALMIIGFGASGVALRRRVRLTATA